MTFGCGCIKFRNEQPPEAFCEYALRHGNTETFIRKIAFCVRFMKEEMYCAPAILWFEMYRSVGDDATYRDRYERMWMDWTEVDALPFMLYLQYLTFGDLRERQRQFHALLELLDTIPLQSLYHPETFITLLVS